MNQKKAGVILSYISEIIKILTGLVYTPIMLRLLGQSEYGLYQLVYSIVSYLSLLSLGFGSSYMRYYSQKKAKNDKEGIAKLNGLFLIIFSLMSLTALICGYFMVRNSRAILGNKMTLREYDVAKKLMILLVINMAVTFPDSIYNCIITANERFYFQKLITVISNIASPLLTLPLLIAGYGSIGMVAVTTFITFTTFFLHFFYCHNKLAVQFSFRELDFQLLKNLGKFTFFIFLNQIIDQINWSIDKFVLGRYSGTTAIAIYGVGAQINTLYVNLSSSISSVFVPQVNRIVAETDDNHALTKLLTRVGRVQFLLLSLILSGLIFCGKEFILIWAGEDYGQSYVVMLLLIIPVTVPLIQNIGIEIQRAKNKHQIRSVVYSLIAIVNVAISIPLAKKYGPAGAALGTAITMIAGNIIFMNWYYDYGIGLDIPYFWKEILSLCKGIIIPVLAGIIIKLFINISNIKSLIITAAIYTIIFVLSMWKFGMNDYEKNMILEVKRKMIK